MCRVCSLGRPVPEQEGPLTFTFKLEQPDGAPADPPMLKTAVPDWRPGETIPLGRDRSLRVVGIVVSHDDEPSVLIVEDVAERASSAEL
jgi:hypothetical protein